MFADRDDNPFHRWNVVFAGYCDGSLWMGDGDTTYGDVKISHHGLANAAAAAALVKRLFPAAPKVVVAGSSAGGYGTLAGYLAARAAMPGAKLYVVNDSGPWRFNPANPEMTAAVQARWNLLASPAFDPPACQDCRVEMHRIADWAMGQDPATRWGIFSFDRDTVIADIYMKFGTDYPLILTETLDFLRARHPGQFQAYVLEGFGHTRFGSDDLYTTRRDGVGLAEWLDAMVDDRDTWESVP